MRLVLENETYGVKVEIDRPGADDLGIAAVIDGIVRPALLAIGYFEVSIDSVLGPSRDESMDELNEAAGL